MTRRSFLAATAAPLLAQERRRPNVLIFLSDQESERVDRSLLRLPNRDKLERRGVRFRRNWCATPQCSPARSAILTGLFPHATGVVANVGAVGAGPLAADVPSLGRLFKDAGYDTGYFGKWHLTPGREIPAEFGFDEARGRGDTPGDAGIAAAAADWIRGREGPWLAFVSVIQPHDIYYFSRLKGNGASPAIRDGIAAPASGAEQLHSKPAGQQLYNEKDQGQTTADYGPDQWRGYRSLYYELIEDADQSLGTVLEAVEGNSQIEDTIAIYTSDHGDALGEHGLAFKGPFMYEELLNVPLAISWPKLTRKAQTSDALTSQVLKPDDNVPLSAE